MGDNCISEKKWDDPELTGARLPPAPLRPEPPTQPKEVYRFPWTESTMIEDTTEEYTTQMRRLQLNHATGASNASIPEEEPQHPPWPGGEMEPPVPIYIGLTPLDPMTVTLAQKSSNCCCN